MAFAGIVLGSSCATPTQGGASGGLSAWDKSREALLAEVIIPSVDNTLGKLDALSQKGISPFKGEDLRALLLAASDVPPAIAAAVDLARPLALVVVAGAPAAPPHTAVALSIRAGSTDQLLGALGERRSTKGEVIEFLQPDGRPLFARVRATDLVLAPTGEALTAAADIAHGARRVVSDDVVAAAFPQAVARWQGQTPDGGRQLLRRRALEEYEQSYRSSGRTTSPPAERATVEAILDLLLPPLSESRSVEFAIAIDATLGLRLQARARPQPGSALARRLSQATPYHLDTRLLLSGAPAIVTAGGPDSFLLELWGAILAAQAGHSVRGNTGEHKPVPRLTSLTGAHHLMGRTNRDQFFYDAPLHVKADLPPSPRSVSLTPQTKQGVKGAAEVDKLFRALSAQLTGAHNLTGRMNQNRIAYDATLLVRSGIPAAQALASLTALCESPALATLLTEVYGARGPKVAIKRVGERLHVRLTLPPTTGPEAAALRSFAGDGDLNVVVAAGTDRLVLSTDPGAEARVGALLAATAGPKPSDELAQALARTAGADSFGYVDLWALVGPLLSTFAGGAQAGPLLGLLPALGGLKLPLTWHHRGGDVLVGELAVPIVTLSNIASTLRMFGGGGALLPR